MTMLRKTRQSKPQLPERVTNSDFCQLFTREMKSLYLLSLLLTANPKKAEQCFITSFEDCMVGISIAKGWTHSWAKHIVIRNAIRLVAPHIQCTRARDASVVNAIDREMPQQRAGSPANASISALADFERFVFVLSVLEHYSDRDTAALLGHSREEIRMGRIQALQQVAAWACESHGRAMAW